jgi:hypothetical protein
VNFRKVLSAVDKGEVVIPVIRAALFDPSFKSFQVKVGGFQARPPDGYFHPSTHPLWEERMLYWYLTEPERLVGEDFDPHGVMAVTQGKFWHSFIEKVGTDCGLFTGTEVAVEDKETGARGHMDGTLSDEVFEFKTMRPAKVAKVPRLSPEDPELAEWYRLFQPVYVAQAQEYMRLSGYRRHRTLLLSLDWPYEMREIVLNADDYFAHAVREKYLRVRQAAADLVPPLPCCGPGSKESQACPARLVCPMGAGLSA